MLTVPDAACCTGVCAGTHVACSGIAVVLLLCLLLCPTVLVVSIIAVHTLYTYTVRA